MDEIARGTRSALRSGPLRRCEPRKHVSGLRRMIVALDANVLLRKIDVASTQYGVANAAIRNCLAQGDMLVLFPQALFETWVVATRPREQNGLGLSVPECQRE